MDFIKTGCTHIEDAALLSVGWDWSGWAVQLRSAISAVKDFRRGLYTLALGGTTAKQDSMCLPACK